MRLYNKEKKEILKLEVELALKNLVSCMKFVRSLEITNDTYYDEYEVLLDEYMTISGLWIHLIDYTDRKEDIEVCDADYLLLKKWGWLNLREYKALYSDIKG